MIRGDTNGDGTVDSNDAVYLLRYVLFAEEYPVSADCDFTGDSAVTSADAVYLLRHVLFGSGYPLVCASFTEQHIKTETITNFGYLLYTPADPVPGMPLVVYLHGGSGKGDDLSLLTSVDGFPAYLQSGELGDLRAYVIMPQLPADKKGWLNAESALKKLIETICSEFDTDGSSIALTGHSMGGTGVWSLALSDPQLFARIAPLSGSVRVTAENAQKLKNIKVRAFAGTADNIVSPESSEEFVLLLKEADCDAEITLFEGATHFEVPALAYKDADIALAEWLDGK